MSEETITMQIQGIADKIIQYKEKGMRIFATSSFQTNSVVLLHILSRTAPDIPIYFINTGFHFPETIRYKDEITCQLKIRVIDLLPHVPKNMQRSPAGDLMFTFDPDYCCFLNKVQPVEALMEQNEIWINGIRAHQNANRGKFREEEPAKHNTLRYHPLLHWTGQDMKKYIEEYDLPIHPLEAKGYKSIGCEPCTRPASEENSREGRWAGMKKTECGLHLGSG